MVKAKDIFIALSISIKGNVRLQVQMMNVFMLMEYTGMYIEVFSGTESCRARGLKNGGKE